jgi:chromosome partitioning protein
MRDGGNCRLLDRHRAVGQEHTTTNEHKRMSAAMGIRLAIANQKGGVGKTTVSMGLAGVLAEEGERVLLIDMDQQGNLSSVFIDNIHMVQPTIADVLIRDADIRQTIRTTAFSGIDILPANLDLANLDSALAGDDDAQFYLIESLQEVLAEYSFMLIDCPPNLSRATRMALVAAQGLIIPIECQEWAVKGSAQLENYIDRVNRRANPGLKILGYVINKYDARRSLESSYNRVLRETFPNKMFASEFNNNVQYTESATLRMPINFYAPHSRQADCFRRFAREVRDHVKKEQIA